MVGFHFSSTAANQTAPGIIGPRGFKGFVALAGVLLVKLEQIFVSKLLQQKRALWPQSDLLHSKGSHRFLCPGRQTLGDA